MTNAEGKTEIQLTRKQN